MATILVSAGGTGGHLFPAEALSAELVRRGHRVELATDERAGKLVEAFPAAAVHVVPAATFGGGGLPGRIRTLWRLGVGYLRSLWLCARIRPQVVVGFGGYPTLPPLIAARTLWRPTLVHEANAVAGRANRLLARLSHVATSFPTVRGLAGLRVPPVRTGLPVRGAVRAVAGVHYPPLSSEEPFRLLVFGGSQGARVFADVVPEAIARLPEALRARLRVTQQCRPEDIGRVRTAYVEAGVEAELGAFFSDLPARMAASHLVIARAGASTVGELATIGRPAILVPLPHALDQDQANNARAMAEAGGAVVLPQADLDAERLAGEIAALADDPARLADAAAAARTLAGDDAAARLADFVEAIVAGREALARFAREAAP